VHLLAIGQAMRLPHRHPDGFAKEIAAGPESRA
jgi:hypothetical protein